MGSFNFKGGFKPKGRDFGAPVAKHKATCSECGNVCEVPFVPTGDRPVYCSNCFDKKRRIDDSPKPEHRNFVPKENDARIVEQLVSLNAKMDKLLLALEPKVTKKKVVASSTSPA